MDDTCLHPLFTPVFNSRFRQILCYYEQTKTCSITRLLPSVQQKGGSSPVDSIRQANKNGKLTSRGHAVAPDILPLSRSI